MPKGNPGVIRRSLADRLWSKAEKIPEAGCWIYMGKVQIRTDNSEPYGRVALPFGAGEVYAHRLAWELTRGQIPEGIEVAHRCDVRLCVNPDHLFLATHAENMHDAGRKRRIARRRKRFTEPQVAEIKWALASGVSGQSLAVRYSVNKGLIYNILHGNTYAYVEAAR